MSDDLLTAKARGYKAAWEEMNLEFEEEGLPLRLNIPPLKMIKQYLKTNGLA